MPNFPPDAGHQPSPADKADMLYNDYLAGGPDAAYKSLKQDYDNSVGMRNRDEYFGQVANQLLDAGHMSNIAISWVRDNKDRLDTDGDGAINRREMQDAANGNGLDAIFGRVVLTRVPSPDDNKTFFDQIAHTKKVWNVDPDSIEDADLRKYGRQMHRAERRDYDQEETIKAAAPLLANHGELLAVLDTGPNGERNNFISGREMNKFLNDYRENMGKGVYTAANAEYVSELLHGTVGRVSSHPFHGFSVNALMRRAGLSEEDLADSRFDAPQEQTKPAPKAEKDQSPDSAGDKQQGKTEGSQAEKFPNLELELRKHVDNLARVQPGEGYNAVAARLLNIFPGHPRTPEEIKQITILGRQIQKLNGDHSTYKLHAGVILPVSSNFDLLMDENPAFKKAMEVKKQTYMENVSRRQAQASRASQAPESHEYDD
ncbi:MAG: hypothetical protein JSS83_20635 [Cyanobacteria bacterium SZAS LIN-3]|nr:hypothetical protein [Cyanobacteria bacterium SZAS LIN-3]MBS2007022.1 hypothetical protein [Cyanobacteria bacterium SZAS TMP-1]